MNRGDAEKIQQLFIKKGWTLGAAESCTGGFVSSLLTALPGASRYFLGSVVAYTNDVKIHLLGVHPDTLRVYGAVSKETALEMAKGALSRLQCDAAIAVTGIAGPDGGTLENPVGTVWLAIVWASGEERVWCVHLKGSRQQVIEQAAASLLNELFHHNS